MSSFESRLFILTFFLGATRSSSAWRWVALSLHAPSACHYCLPSNRLISEQSRLASWSERAINRTTAPEPDTSALRGSSLPGRPNDCSHLNLNAQFEWTKQLGTRMSKTTTWACRFYFVCFVGYLRRRKRKLSSCLPVIFGKFVASKKSSSLITNLVVVIKLRLPREWHETHWNMAHTKLRQKTSRKLNPVTCFCAQWMVASIRHEMSSNSNKEPTNSNSKPEGAKV